MAGNSNKREENYDIKYLRKALMQVDDRIRVPERLDASSLRPLLDDIEPASLRETARRRPRWLSLQSGIAYAAAFALIVALFYSMELYKPDMIHGGMRIASPKEQAQPSLILADAPDEAGTEPRIEADTFAATGNPAEDAQPQAAAAPEAPMPAAFAEGNLGVGGSGESVLLFEQDNYEYRWRANDVSDPDREGPVTFEVINKDSQEIAAQIDVAEMTDIQRCLVYEDMLVLVGSGDDGIALQVYYDAEAPARQLSLSQPGSLVDVRLYKDVVHIVSLSDEVQNDGGEVVALPNTDSSEACTVTAVNLSTLETSSKTFTGADGTIQLHNFNVYIHYGGTADDGSPKDYIGQILLDGMDIELGTVS